MASPKFDSERFYEQLLEFAKNCQKLIKDLPVNIWNKEYGKQLSRSSSSPGANYLEALEAESKKDFIHKLKICRKETRESLHWLNLVHYSNENIQNICLQALNLTDNGKQITRLLTASILTLEKKKQE